MSEHVRVWHITPRSCIESILRQGLIAQRGPRSKKANEPLPAVYCFTSGSAVEQALLNWADDEFEGETLSLLEGIVHATQTPVFISLRVSYYPCCAST